MSVQHLEIYLAIFRLTLISATVFAAMAAIKLVLDARKKKDETKEEKRKQATLSYSFINNSILLSTETIQKNGFHEIWRQENEEHSIQILCFNNETKQFQAFDRFHWMDEPEIVKYKYPSGWGYDEKGNFVHEEHWLSEGVHYKKDLWTPIELHCTEEWLKGHLK